jgi:hypothetical protein
MLLGGDVAWSADNAATLQEACKTVLTNCRHDLTVHFRQLDGTEYRKTFELTYPPVQNKTSVTIFPGETLHLAATVDGDRISELVPVSVVDDASRTIELTLGQMPDKPDMMLTVTNPFNRLLKYRAAIQVPPQSDLIKTSTCTVLAGKQGIETWPYPVFQVLLSEFQFLPATDQMVCE